MSSQTQQTKENSKIFKSGLDTNRKVLVGGNSFEDLPNKTKLLQELTAKARKAALEEANEIIKKAEIMAKELEHKTSHNIDELKEDAYTRSFEAGYQKGLLEAEEKMQIMLETKMRDFDNLITAFDKARQEILDHEEEQVMEFIQSLAKKILCRDLSYKAETMLELIKESIALLNDKAEVSILINPETAEELNKLKTKLIKDCPGLELLTVTADEQLDINDFILEAGKERLDVRAKARIDEIVDEVLGA